MRNKRAYKSSDYSNNKEKDVKMFLHHAFDHMWAAKILKDVLLLDSSAYLCYIAFEILLKALRLYKFTNFDGVHGLLALSDNIDFFYLEPEEKDLLKIIDQFNLLRYPIDNATDLKLETAETSPYPDEVSTDDLEKALNLFKKILEKLEENEDLKNMLLSIYNDPFKKGNRIMMSKPKAKKIIIPNLTR